MSHVHEGPLAGYNSLTDSHLAGYFANGRMRRHLRKAGLVSRHGQIVTESTYRLNMSRREHKKHVKDMLAQAIVYKTLDMERSRQAEIKKKLEEIAKIQLVRRVRASTDRKGDEDVLPLLTPRSGRSSSSPSPRGWGQRGSKNKSPHGPRKVPGVRRGDSARLSDMSWEEDGDVLYLDDEGHPITSSAFSDRRRSPEQNNIDTRHLHSLDSVALRKYAMLVAQMDEGRGLTSPYMMPQMPLPPRPPSSARTPRSFRRVQSASPRRTITTDSRLARLHRPETAKSHAGDQQTLCRVAMKYHGWALNLAREKTDHTQEVVIEQQHCGGNTLTVFKERLEPGTKFDFISYRHRGYPFSLSLYVDGQMDSRVSTCCEYRHSRGAKIGGKQGHFSLLRVSGAVPCYKCQVAKGVRKPSRASPKKLKRPAEVRREEVIVVSTRRHQEEEADDYYAQERFEPVEDEEEEDEVLVPVERDEHDSQDERDQTDSRLNRSAQSDDYADDFEDSQASSEKAKSSAPSSSSSESESEAESVTPKEEGKKQEKKRREERKEEEFFQRKEDRGEEREEEEEEEEEKSSPRGRESDRQYSARSPRVEVNGTGRQIDDYSSDDEADGKTKLISVEDVDTDSTPIKSRRRSSSSSSSSAEERTQTSQGKGGAPVISMDPLNREEKKEEDAQQERERREAIRQKEEQDLLQKHQVERQRRTEERKKAEEARRQEDLLRQERRDEERRQREEQRQAEAEKERLRREEEEESRRRAAEAERDPEAKERERMRAQRDRDAQIRQEQTEREQQRRGQEQEREQAWKRQEEKREEKRQRDMEERERKREEEGSSTARTDSSTARSITASESSDDDARDIARAASPLPPAATYEDRRRLREPQQEDSAPPRATSPFPAAAEYDADWRRHRQQQEGRDASPRARPVSPFPPPAVYEDRKKAQRAEEEHGGKSTASSAPLLSVSLPSESSSEEDDDDDNASEKSLEMFNEARVYSKEAPRYRGESSSEGEAEPRHSKKAVRYVSDDEEEGPPPPPQPSEKAARYGEDEDPAPQESRQAETNDRKDSSEDEEEPPPRHSKKRMEATSSSEDESSSTSTPRPQPVQKTAGTGGRQEEDSGTADSSSDSDTSSGSGTEADDSATATTAERERGSGENAKEKAAEGDETPGPHVTSESDGENMHGGADPDNVAQQEEVGELHPLRTRERPAAKAHQGEITDLLKEGKDSVDLSNVLLNKTQVYQLASHLEGSSQVKMVTLCNAGLDDDDLQRLTEALAVSPSEPVMLNLSLNSVSQKGVQHVLHVLKAKPSIKLLILQGNPIGDEGAEALTNGLQDLHRQARTARKAVAMETVDTMSVDSSSSSIDPSSMAQRYILQELDLTDTELSDDGASHLAQLVASNVYLENVNLSQNPRITPDEGWKRVGEALARNRCIRSLTLDGNRLGDEGTGHIARGLQSNRVLRSLALEDAGIGEAGGKSLMDMLKRNTTILELTLSPGNTIPPGLADDIGKYISLNRVPYNSFGAI